MSETKFGVWSVPQSTAAIHYSLVVIEEIRHEVSQGFQKMARGGIEVGGILYGRQADGGVNILAMRPISCEHSLGPSFQLSERDRAVLRADLEQAAGDPQLEGLAAVGFFLSHTRSEISLAASDMEMYTTYFPENWQIAMVIRPGRAGATRAGFFFREADGSVAVERSYLEFNFPDRLAGVLDRPRAERAPPERERRTGSPHSQALAAAAAPLVVPVVAEPNGA